MGIRVTQRSFAGGELSPALTARNDISKYQTGLKCLKNGIVKQEGCIQNRAGLEFVCEAKYPDKKCRLIPFSFNTEQTYIIECGHKYFRFIKDGGVIVYPDNWGDATETTPADPEKQALKGQIVEIPSPYDENELFMVKYAQSADVLTMTHANHAQIELSRYSHYDWRVKTIDFKPSIEPPTNLKGTWSGSGNNPRNYQYVVTAVDEKTDEESNRSAQLEVTGRYEAYWAVGEQMTISFDIVPGAAEYNIYRSVNGIFGYIGTTKTNSFIDDKIEPDLSSTAPILKNPFESENYPSATTYFQQRKLYANSFKNPQTIWASQTATNDNFNISRPLVATDAVTLAIREGSVNEIRHLVSLNDLIVLTSSAEWKVNGSDGVFSASPAPMTAIQSYYGSSHVMPAVSGNMILFVQSGGAVIRDLGYQYLSNGYDGDELTIFANHLFEGHEIIDMAYAKEPYRILWTVLNNGKCNGLTYNRKQEMCAWHKHETKGNFESVAVIREGNEDIPYFAIERKINNQTKRYIERMKSRLISNCKNGFFVDSGLSYEGEAAKTICGLEHLEGEEVIILADGGVVTGRTVKNGTVNLKIPASKIVIGLPYEFEVETLNIEGETTHGLKKIASNISVKVDKSRQDFFVVGSDGSEYQNPRIMESINDAGFLYSGDVMCFPAADYSPETTVRIKQKYPLPLTILSISAIVELENASN